VIARLKDGARRLVRGALAPLVTLLLRAGVSPDAVTWVGLLVTVTGGVLIGLGHFRWGALVALAGCLMDSLDGALARAKDGATRWGAFLDSTTDRVADGALFMGVAAFYARVPMLMLGNPDVTLAMQLGPDAVRAQYQELALESWIYAGVAVLALVGAYLVSYTRARMEGLGVECKVGWFERPERLALFLGAALFGAASPVMPWALVVLAVMSFVTALQRMGHARARLTSPAESGSSTAGT
jgi:CDP-diacylglycerol--glycerol-3-phosphate 3-phosphatidyltransferase